MPKRCLPPLAGLLHSFFHLWLVEQRDASEQTIHSYRDAWRLLLRFVAERRKRRVANLGLEDLTAKEILAFLQHLENERHSSVITRNCRLAALRSFFSFVAEQEPLAAKQCAEVLHIPFKRAQRRAMTYMEPAEVSAILAQPDRTTPEGQRDHAILSFLYNTGARIQEALDVRPQDLHLSSPAHVRLTGKGRKERISPLWPETAQLMTSLIKRGGIAPDKPVFNNRHGVPLTASGFRFRLRKYVITAQESQRSLKQSESRRTYSVRFR